MISKIFRFIRSFFSHAYRNFPKSTQSEINKRYEICTSCEFYDSVDSVCLKCGCNINNKKIFMNKLAWADQSCPIKKWEPIKK